MTSDPRATGNWQIVSPLEIPDWDRQLAAFRDAGVFHGCGWARTLVQTYGHRPAYLVLKAAAGFDAVLPLMEVRGLFGRCDGISLPFTDSCPPLLKEGGGLRLSAIVDAAVSCGRSAGWRSVEIRCADATLFPSSSVTFHTHQLDLAAGPGRLFDQCRPEVRRAIRRAQEAGLTIDFPTGIPALETYYQLHCLTRQRHGLPPQPWRFFRLLAGNLVDGQSGFVARARLGSHTLAAAVFLMAGSRAHFKYGASDKRFQHLRPNNLVMWEAMKRLAGSRSQVLDLGRTSMSNEGLRRFKLGWGAAESQLYYYRIRTADRAVLPIRDRSMGWHTLVFRALPPRLSQWIGNVLYRFQS